MAGFERNLPPSLRERMNDDGEASTFQSWFRQRSDITVSSSTIIQTTYEEETSQFVRISDNTGLRAALQKYLDEHPTDEFWQNCNPELCSWNQVIQELDVAKEVYRGKAKGNPVRRAFRHGSGFSRNLKPLLEAVPQDDGLGLLKGGLQIIFSAVQRRTETCERIFDAFEDIPDSIMRAEKLREICPQDDGLAAAFASLNNELVKCIPVMIDVLLRRSDKSKISQFGKTVFGDSLRDINTILKPLEDAEKRLKECQGMFDTRSIATTRLLSEETVQKVTSVQQGVDNVDEKVDRIEEIMGSLDSKFDAWKREEAQQRQTCIDENALREVTQLMNSCFQMYHEMRRVPCLCPESSRAVVSRISRSLRVKFMDAICTGEERLSTTRDLCLVLRKYHEFSNKTLAQANHLIMAPRFQSWLTGPFSDIILVDGHCSETVGKVAPTSVFCAGLVESISGRSQSSPSWALPQQPQSVLSFFAGEHMTPSSSLLGPRGMIRSLVDQLLLRWPDDDLPDLRFLEGQPMQFAMEGGLDIPDLCHVFEELISQLGPNSSIWCIIDGVSFFETSLHGWMDELSMIVQSFVRCVTQTDGRNGVGPVKFLLVSPDKSTVVWNSIPAHCRVDLRAGNLHSRSITLDNMAAEIHRPGW